ncbi:MAG: hypothetical protein K6T65_11965 [Peptococcaceae bacterium]|nr:hypothetical protein [Peptococcaceae bacterium]
MKCKLCQSPMRLVKATRPEEVIEIDMLDFLDCMEVVLWCCEKCGYTHVSNRGLH